MSTVATIEARMTSSRLPGKMALPLGEATVLGVLIDRLRRAPELDRIVLATTTNSADDVLADIAGLHQVEIFRGSEDDVLGRVRGALDMTSAEVCVEITGDCPLIDPTIVSKMVREFRSTRGQNTYVANTTGPKFGAPQGLDVQVFEANALRTLDVEATDDEAREHVSLPFYRADGTARWRPRFVEFFPDALCRQVWFSLDYREDYDLIRSIYDELSAKDPAFGAREMIDACLARPEATRACLSLRGM